MRTIVHYRVVYYHCYRLAVGPNTCIASLAYVCVCMCMYVYVYVWLTVNVYV